MGIDPNRMDQNLYENGKAIGYYTIPKEIANMICRSLCLEGYNVDWHYMAGRVVVRTLDEDKIDRLRKVFGIFQLMNENYEEEAMDCGTCCGNCVHIEDVSDMCDCDCDIHPEWNLYLKMTDLCDDFEVESI